MQLMVSPLIFHLSEDVSTFIILDRKNDVHQSFIVTLRKLHLVQKNVELDPQACEEIKLLLAS